MNEVPTAQVVTGYRWGSEGVTLETYGLDAPRTASSRVLGPTLRLQVLAGRRCLGSVDMGSGQPRPCPSAAEVQDNHCDRCRPSADLLLCMACDGRRCPRLGPVATAQCRQPHRLYLASFGCQEIKVGTTAASRENRRLYEQGPLAAAYVASGPGPTIKRLEAVAAEAGFVDSMRRSRKLALLRSGTPYGQAAQRIVDAASDLANDLPPEDRSLLSLPPQFISMPRLTTLAYELDAPIEPIIVTPADLIEGDVVAAAGNNVILDDGTFLWALDLKDLSGRPVIFDPTESPSAIRPRQLSLTW